MNKDSMIKLHTGRQMPLLGLGTWKLTDNTAEDIAYALSIGYRMIDTSSDYKTQPGIGQGIKKSGVSRDSFYLVTKVEETDDAYDRVKSNLKELQLDYADLMLIHRPPKNGVGEKLWEDLARSRDEGLVRDIGVSNYSADQIDKLIDLTGEVPAVNQIEWSPFGHSDEMLKHCTKNGTIIQAYSPLTRGDRLDNTTLHEIADKYGKSPAQILIRWNLQYGVVPIVKADEKKHLEENIDVFDFEILDEDMDRLSNLNEHYSALGELPYIKKETFKIGTYHGAH